MIKRIITLSALMLLSTVSLLANSDCRVRDSLALIGFYEATDGANWNITWNLDDPIDTWWGVKLNDNGCVSELKLCEDCVCYPCTGNGLNGTLPFSIGDLTELEVFAISNEPRLSGSLPTTIGKLTNVRFFSIVASNLNGEIPQEIGDMVSLDDLRLHNNNLSGEIPESLYNLKNLYAIFIGNNELSGEISPQVAQLPLHHFGLQGNKLSGELPDVWDQFDALYSFNVSHNQIEGEIPSSLGANVQLQHLILNDNRFEGCIPASLKDLCYLSTTQVNDRCTEYLGCQFDLRNNPLLPWQGNFARFCAGEDQVGAPCDDNDYNTTNDRIDENCDCKGVIEVCVSDVMEPNNEIGAAAYTGSVSSITDLCISGDDQDWYLINFRNKDYYLQITSPQAKNHQYELSIDRSVSVLTIHIKSDYALSAHLYLSNRNTRLISEQGINISLVYEDNGELPDLVLQNIEHRKVAERGDQIELKARLLNKGRSLSPSSSTLIYLTDSDMNDLYHLGEIQSASVVPGIWSPAIGVFQLPTDIAEGKYYIKFKADGNRKINEADESNNIAYSPVIIMEYLACQGDQYESNNSKSAAYELGHIDESISLNDICLSPDDRDYFSFVVGDRQYYLQVKGYDAISQGPYGLKIETDQEWIFVESYDVSDYLTDTYLYLYDEDFNLLVSDDDSNGYPYSKLSYQHKESLPDLTIRNSLAAPEEIYPDHEFIVSTQVWNIGDKKVEASTLKYYLSNDNKLSVNDRIVGVDMILPLGVSSYLPASTVVKLPSDYAAGEYYLILSSDDLDQIEESDETNNIAVIKILVKQLLKADLTISESTINQDVIDRSGYIEVNTTFKNIGTLSAPYNFVGYFLSMDDQLSEDDQLMHYGFVNAMDEDQSAVLRKEVLITQKFEMGKQYLIVKVDGFERIEELREDNNTYAHEIEIVDTRRADLYVRHFNTAPETNDRHLPFSIQINNNGDKKSEVTEFAIYFSQNEIFDNDDIFLYQEDMPEIYPESFFNSSGELILPDDYGAGEFYLIVRLDEEQYVRESDESNNEKIVAFNAQGNSVLEGSYTTLPYLTGFELGGWDNYWDVEQTESNNIRVTTEGEPYEGFYHVIMDSGKDEEYQLNSMSLRVDLSGHDQVDMRFAWKDYGDETHDEDGIYFSDDGGLTFVKVFDFNPQKVSNDRWIEEILYVDELAKKHKLLLNSTFVIKFQEYDNYSYAYDGIAIDEIEIKSEKTRKVMASVRSYVSDDNNDPIESELSIEVYPNPVTDLITIVAKDREVITQVSIYNISGQLVITKNIIGEDKIDMSQLSSGSYMIRAYSDNSAIYSQLVLKQ